MRLNSMMRGLCAVALGLLPTAILAQHSSGQYVQQVNKATLPAATTQLTSSLNPSTYTQNVTFTLTVPKDATGSVSFFDGSTAIGSPVAIVANSGAVATSTTTLSVGNHTITATYSGDSNYSATTTPIGMVGNPQVVNKGTGTLAVASTPNPSTFGQSVGFTATLASGATGTVTFYDSISGTAVSIGTGTASNGTATFSTTTLTVGTHPITAQYAGDANFAAITTSNTDNQVVSKAASTSDVLTYSPLTPTYGQQITFTDTLPTNATGVITFTDGSVTLGTGTIVNGVATFTTTTPLAAGSHTITATYPGDSNYAPATATVTFTIGKQTAETATLVSSLNPAAAGSAVTFTVTLPSNATGTVQFMDGATAIGSPVTVTAGSAAYTTSTLAVGTHPITAVYSGDSNYSNVTSNAVSEVISVGTATVSIAGVPNPSTYGQNVTMTITVQGVNGVAPTGSVTLSFGGNPLGGTLTLTPGTGGTSTATYQTAALPAGADTITATYSGDSNYK